MLRKLIDQRSSSSSSLDPLVPIFHDGGFATECERRGVELNHRLWSTKVLLDAPETVVGVHRSFLDHGSDVVSTATYQLHGKAAATVGCNVRELAAQAVHAARKACDECQRGLVAGSLGPYGATIPGGLEFTGDYRAPDEGFAAFHRPRIEALVEAGVDLILLETFPRADEAVEAALVAHEIAGEKSIPIVVSMTMRFDTTPQDVAPRVVTAAGDSPMTTFQTLQGIPSVAFVGVNCSEPEVATALLSELAATNGGWRLRDDVGLAVYPNSGERYVAGEQVGTGSWDASHMQGPQALIGNRLAAHWPTWHRLLVACGGGRSRLPLLLGGCCRVYPEDIRGLRDAVVS